MRVLLIQKYVLHTTTVNIACKRKDDILCTVLSVGNLYPMGQGFANTVVQVQQVTKQT